MEQPEEKPRDYVAELKQHVAQFGYGSLIDALISDLGDHAKEILERIKGHKVSDGE